MNQAPLTGSYIPEIIAGNVLSRFYERHTQANTYLKCHEFPQAAGDRITMADGFVLDCKHSVSAPFSAVAFRNRVEGNAAKDRGKSADEIFSEKRKRYNDEINQITEALYKAAENDLSAPGLKYFVGNYQIRDGEIALIFGYSR